MTTQNNGAAGTNDAAVKNGEMAGVKIVGLSADGKTLAVEIGTTEQHKSKNGNPVFGQAMWVPVTLNGDDPERATVAKLNVMFVVSPDDTAKLRQQLRDKVAGRTKPADDARGGSTKNGELAGMIAAQQAQINTLMTLLAERSQPAPQPVAPPVDMAAVIAQAVAAAVAAVKPVETVPAAKPERRKAKPAAAESVAETPAAE